MRFLILALVLSQEPEQAPTSDAPEEAAAVKVDAPVVRRGPPEELTRLLAKLKDAPIEQRQGLIDEIQKKFAAMVPGVDIDVGKYRELSEADQAKVIARDFLTDVLAGNASGAAAKCGVPFVMEDHRIDHAEDLRTEWARHLRSKRTDLMSVYDIEVLTPADMEKKYGKAPQRLQSWNWRSSGTLFAVANVSGRASVMLMKQFGAVWQVVGYHD